MNIDTEKNRNQIGISYIFYSLMHIWIYFCNMYLYEKIVVLEAFLSVYGKTVQKGQIENKEQM